MKTQLRSVLVFSLVLVVAAPLLAQSSSSNASEGEKLERLMWADMKAKNWPAVEARLAPGFQSVHPDGPRDRAAELALIKALKLGEFTLKDFKVTQGGDDLVVTYWISVQEVVDGKTLSSKPAMRLSIWEKTKAGWQWVAHANLNPL